MKKDPLNNRLIDEFPKLKETYQEVKGGVFDLDTPASNFYEGVFVPYLMDCMNAKNEKEIRHCFAFIEDMICDEDEAAQNVAMSSILCVLSEKGVNLADQPLGKESRNYFQSWIKE